MPDLRPTAGFVCWNVEAALKLPEDFDRMDADYEKFKAYLIQEHAAGLPDVRRRL